MRPYHLRCGSLSPGRCLRPWWSLGPRWRSFVGFQLRFQFMIFHGMITEVFEIFKLFVAMITTMSKLKISCDFVRFELIVVHFLGVTRKIVIVVILEKSIWIRIFHFCLSLLFDWFVFVDCPTFRVEEKFNFFTSYGDFLIRNLIFKCNSCSTVLVKCVH